MGQIGLFAAQTSVVGKASKSTLSANSAAIVNRTSGKHDDAISIPLRDDFAPPTTPYRYATSSDDVWLNLLQEGMELRNAGSKNNDSNKYLGDDSIVLEVGMHKLLQCRLAAIYGFHAHCVEPSPVNFQSVHKAYRMRTRNNATLRDHIHLYNVAAGRESNQTLHFLSSGSTGDTVLTEQQALNSSAKNAIVKVPTMRLDDLIKPFNSVFLAKIDTQGFEPQVVAGMQESLAMQKVDYLLMEFWPRGMDKLSPAGSPRCESAIQMLQNIAQAGYTLYQLKMEWHPKEPIQGADEGTKAMLLERPFDNIRKNCNWFYEFEEKVPIESIGYWSDVLAVSPKSRLPEVPLTSVGKLLLAGRNK